MMQLGWEQITDSMPPELGQLDALQMLCLGLNRVTSPVCTALGHPFLQIVGPQHGRSSSFHAAGDSTPPYSRGE